MATGPTQRPMGKSILGRLETLRRWSVANPVTALTLAGVLSYGSLRFGATVFFSRLGFTPEEVGLGYAEMLARAALGLLIAALIGLWA